LSDVLLLTGARESSAEILPALDLLPHSVRLGPADPGTVAGGSPVDVVLIDSRRDLMHAKGLFRLLRGSGLDLPVLAIVAEGGWAAVTSDWGADDVILNTAGPGEIEARLRLAIGRRTVAALSVSGEIRSGELVIDEASYTVRLHGRVLDLTFKEFELLKFLAQHPGRVFTRSQLLQEVWGYDYFGGTRTVDVHVRRLRAKLGAEYELLIGTVRNVGYRFVPSQDKPGARRKPPGSGSELIPAVGELDQAVGEPDQAADELDQAAGRERRVATGGDRRAAATGADGKEATAPHAGR
jgi:DNA-binding response OmpR family regulator